MIHELALSMINGIGSVRARELLAHFGSAAQVFELAAKEWPLLKGKQERLDLALERAERELIFMQANGIRSVFISSADYPYRLRQCADAPIILFVKGTLNPQPKRILAVVGTRKMSDYGKRQTEKIIAGLKGSGLHILSGLAYGIDACAHRQALESGLETSAVLGNHLGQVYPEEHYTLAERVSKSAALISELASFRPSIAANFPMRNRIVAGMSDAVLVVESGLKGGAMITAKLGFDYDRSVMAVPGRSTDRFSAGCNALIKRDQARMVESAEDLLEWMNWDRGLQLTIEDQAKAMKHLDPGSKKLLELLRSNAGSRTRDQLLGIDRWLPGELAAAVMDLELNGLIESSPGPGYRLK